MKTLLKVREYWNANLHDEKMSSSPKGSKQFFDDISNYHFEKLDYLPKIISFASLKGKRVLGMGCGMGIDLLKFAQNGAKVTGIDIAEKPLSYARKNFKLHGQSGNFMRMDGEHMSFKDNTFDAVFAHGVLQWTPKPQQMIDEIKRVLKPGGMVFVGVYHKYSWLPLFSTLTRTPLEHCHAPIFRMFSRGEMRKLFSQFSQANFYFERFPKKTSLHKGTKAKLYNNVFIPLFNVIPRSWISFFGCHIVGEARK